MSSDIDRVVHDLATLDLDRTAHAASVLWAWGMAEISSENLKAARRKFAKAHHPDIAGDGSAARMSLANHLLDEATRGTTND